MRATGLNRPRLLLECEPSEKDKKGKDGVKTDMLMFACHVISDWIWSLCIHRFISQPGRRPTITFLRSKSRSQQVFPTVKVTQYKNGSEIRLRYMENINKSTRSFRLHDLTSLCKCWSEKISNVTPGASLRVTNHCRFCEVTALWHEKNTGK